MRESKWRLFLLMSRLFVLLSLLLLSPALADTACTLSGVQVQCPFNLTPSVYSCNGRNLAVIDVAVTDTSTVYRFNREGSYLIAELGNYSLMNEKESGSMKLFWPDSPSAFNAIVQMGSVVGTTSFSASPASCPCQISFGAPKATFNPSTGWVEAEAALSSQCTDVGSVSRFLAVTNGTRLIEIQRVLGSSANFTARGQMSYSGEEIKGYKIVLLASGPLAYGVEKLSVLNFNDFLIAAPPAVGAPGQLLSADISIKNLGNEPDQYIVTALPPAGWETSPVMSAQINPGSQLTQKISIKPPAGFSGGADIPVTVKASDGLERTAILHIDAKQFFSASASFDSERSVTVNSTFRIRGYWNVSGTIESEVRYWFYVDPFIPINDIEESASMIDGILPFQFSTSLLAACSPDKKLSSQALALQDLRGYSYGISKFVAASDKEKVQRLVAKALPLIYTAGSADPSVNSTLEAVRTWLNATDSDKETLLAQLSDMRLSIGASLDQLSGAAQTDNCIPVTKVKLVMRTLSLWDLAESTISRDIGISALEKINVAIEPANLTVIPGQSATATLVITNKLAEKQIVLIEPTVSVFSIRTSANALELEPQQSGKVTITVGSTEALAVDADVVDFMVTVGKSVETVSLSIAVERPKFQILAPAAYEITEDVRQLEVQLENTGTETELTP